LTLGGANATADKLPHRIRSLFRRDRLNGELNAELEFHLEREVQEKVAAGMSPQEARAPP